MGVFLSASQSRPTSNRWNILSRRRNVCVLLVLRQGPYLDWKLYPLPPTPLVLSLCQLSNFPFVAAVGNFKFWHFWKQWPDPACLPLLHTPSCSCSLAIFLIFKPQVSVISTKCHYIRASDGHFLVLGSQKKKRN